ncbi:MAG: methyltransferase domain-containing protein [Gemmatimonadota bacterium]|nr:MAG: methyltransferase domain-containing protein [Gemmatimonadota bacterium]
MTSIQHRQYFNERAESWDRTSAGSERLSEVVSRCGLQSGQRVIDIGCGTGTLIPHIKNCVGKEGTVYALDFAEEMLRVLKTDTELSSVILICADIVKIPVCDHFFDHVLCFATFPHFNDKRAALSEMRRILKTGGKMTIAHLMGSREMNQFHGRAGGVVQHDYLPHGEEMKELLRRSHFSEINVVDEPNLYLAQGVK